MLIYKCERTNEIQKAEMDEHGKDPEAIVSNFKILKKCQNKLDCLIFEMVFIRDLEPKLNKQCDSIRAKLFV